MEKNRELRDESENTASRREFLHQAAGAGLVVAATLAPNAGLAERVSPSRRPRRAGSTLVASAQAGVYHIVSALEHPDDKQHKRRLVLAWDATKSALVLDQAKVPVANGPKYQIWEVWTDGSIRNKGFSDGQGYLEYNPNNLNLPLKPVAQPDAGYELVWWTAKLGDHVLITPHAENGVQYVLRADPPSLDGNGKFQATTVTLDKLRIPDPGHSWTFVPTKDGIPLGGDPGVQQGEVVGLITKSHVPDQCDSLWHNPACPGNPATWTGCGTINNLCMCIHSS